MRRFNSLLVMLLVVKFSLSAQEPEKKDFVPAIEDNSFFIEEAYNQEDRVVQHINNGTYMLGNSHDFIYTFTQEWPVFSQKHQFSYTIGYSFLNSGNIKGINDIMLNYRYQLTGHDAVITIAPRFSVILPAGNSRKGLGSGVVGYQFDLPMSKRITNSLAIHANLGFTILPYVTNTDLSNIKHKNTLRAFNAGASAIWLISSKSNLMLELVHLWSQEVNENNLVVNTGQTIISPGIRHAIDIKSLQIVPGLAFPFTVQNGNINGGVFFYLSFEHPF